MTQNFTFYSLDMSGYINDAEYREAVKRVLSTQAQNTLFGVNLHDPNSATLVDIPICPFTRRHVFPQITNIVMTGVDHVSPAPKATSKKAAGTKRPRNSRNKQIDLLRIAQCTPGADLNPHRFAAARMTLRANLRGKSEEELCTLDFSSCKTGTCETFLRHLLQNGKIEDSLHSAKRSKINSEHCDLASRATGLYFDTGKYVVTGTASDFQALMAIQKIVAAYANAKQTNGIPTPQTVQNIMWPKCNVENVVASMQLFPPPHNKLNLRKIADCLGSECTYEPDLFPGVIYRPMHRGSKLKCFLLFESGQSVLAGSRNEKEVFQEFKKFVQLIYQIQYLK